MSPDFLTSSDNGKQIDAPCEKVSLRSFPYDLDCETVFVLQRLVTILENREIVIRMQM